MTTMNRAEIIDKLALLLRQHHEGLRGHIGQEPYKGDIFQLFTAACELDLFDYGQHRPMFADAIIEVIVERATPDAKPTKITEAFYTMWSEWTYAWRNLNHLPKVD
jgi:hypothetical protein